ncbi:MAG: GNAT family N-acetyltransferase [Burkholderiales bacterium]|nr:GNAT family N-acetyltransferase [Burkholderiales bacterium]
MQIQSLCYGPAFHEPALSFATKLAAAPQAAWLALIDDQPAAYLITLPMQTDDSAPQLPTLSDTAAQPVATSPNWLYIHDMAVAAPYRGTGVGSLLFQQTIAYATARNITQMALIAVQGSMRYWQGMGFATDCQPAPHIAAKLRTFGEDAVFMTRHLIP